MRQSLNLPLGAALIVALGMGSVIAYRAAGPEPTVPPCRVGAESMERVELLFGMHEPGGEVGEADWRAFLEVEVTPRFPDGLTVLTGYGQWRNSTGVIAKEASRVLLIWAKPAPGNSANIEAIRVAWKARFQQDSVMRVDGVSCVSF